MAIAGEYTRKPRGKLTRRLFFRLTDKQSKSLAALSRRSGQSVADLIRRGLDLVEQEASAEREARSLHKKLARVPGANPQETSADAPGVNSDGSEQA